MIEVDQYKDIRRYYVEEGLSERAIAKLMGVSRNTVRKYKDGAVLPGQRKTAVRESPVTGPIREIVARYLEEDQGAPAKQKQTAKRIWTRLPVEHGFQGAYSTVRALVRELKGTSRAYIPLQFDPGQAAQVDWGTAYAHIAGVKTKVQLFCMRLCNSGAIYVMAFPTQRYESLLAGHVEAFKFFSGVPRTLIYDNMRTVVKEGWGKHVKKEQAPFKLLKAHYVFGTRFCNPNSGNEKGLVENLVALARRNVMSPMPKVESYAELNKLLLAHCVAYADEHKIENRPAPVGKMLEIERRHMLPLPEAMFDPAIAATAKVNRYALVRYDNSYYSVPARFAGQKLTVKAYPLRIEVWCKGERIALHQRTYEQNSYTYCIEHYLPVLEKKIRAVRDAAPVRQSVNESIRTFGEKLVDKDFVAVLKLAVDYGETAVIKAIEVVASHDQYSYEAVRFQLLQAINPTEIAKPIKVDSTLPTVRPVDLSQYDALYKAVATNE